MNIILIGYKGAGKTTIAKFYANSFAKNYLDTDELILKATGFEQIYDLYQSMGDNNFRALETKIINGLICDNAIIATGGGVVLNPDNIKCLQQLGLVIYLKLSPKILFSRLKAPTSITDFTSRDHLYTNAANFIVDAGLLSVPELANIIYGYENGK